MAMNSSNILGEAQRLLRPFWPVTALATGVGTSGDLATAWLLDRALTDGAKELGLNRARRAQVHGTLLADAADRTAGFKSDAMRRFWIKHAVRTAIFSAAIAILLAVHGRLGSTCGAILVLLYVNRPIDQIIGALPTISQAQIAFQHIASMMADFRESDLALRHMADPETNAVRSARYTFPSEGGKTSFELGRSISSSAAVRHCSSSARTARAGRC